MKARVRDKTQGQTLAQVAILLVVLLAFLALAVDMGWTYAGRRKMQNAADAGALAGAYELCFGTPENAEATALEYAITRNNAEGATVDIVDWTVTVVATETRDLFVADVVNLPELVVGAEAAAACGAASSACGLWPVTVSVYKWEELLTQPASPGGPYRNCVTEPFYVWTGDNENNNPDCEIYDCDVDDDGAPEIVDVINRGWVDFSDVVDPTDPGCAQSGCGEAEMECWIESDSREELIVGHCYPGLSGVKAGAKDDVEARIGDNVSIPLYDSIDECTSARACPGGHRYHLAGFGCMTVMGWVHELTLPRLDGGNPPWKGKAIMVAVNCPGCETKCGFTTGAPPVPGGVNAVSLIR